MAGRVEDNALFERLELLGGCIQVELDVYTESSASVHVRTFKMHGDPSSSARLDEGHITDLIGALGRAAKKRRRPLPCVRGEYVGAHGRIEVEYAREGKVALTALQDHEHARSRIVVGVEELPKVIELLRGMKRRVRKINNE